MDDDEEGDDDGQEAKVAKQAGEDRSVGSWRWASARPRAERGGAAAAGLELRPDREVEHGGHHRYTLPEVRDRWGRSPPIVSERRPESQRRPGLLPGLPYLRLSLPPLYACSAPPIGDNSAEAVRPTHPQEEFPHETPTTRLHAVPAAGAAGAAADPAGDAAAGRAEGAPGRRAHAVHEQ